MPSSGMITSRALGKIVGLGKNIQSRRKYFNQLLGSPPVLMIRGLALAGGPELGDHHVEDGDEEERVGGEQQEDRAHVDPLVVGVLGVRHEGALVRRLVGGVYLAESDIPIV